MTTSGQGTYRVLVTDQLSGALVDAPAASYASPPQPERDARCLVRLLLGRSRIDGTGPWRQAVAGGQRLIELEQQP